MTIAYYIASPSWGGGEQYVYDLARTLKAEKGVRILFLFPPHSDAKMVERFSELGECPTFNYTGKLWRFSLFAGYQLAIWLKQNHVDILHLNNRIAYFQAAVAKRFYDYRLIATQHLIRTAKNGFLWQWTYRKIDTLICVSQFVKRQYLSAFPEKKCPFRNVQVLINSVTAPVTEQICRQDVDVPRIFYHGRVCEEKGVYLLLDIAEQLLDTPFELHIAGAVPQKEQARWEKALGACRAKERIRLLGFCTNIWEHIPNYQIAIMPSLVPEACPIALLDTMAMGLPCIASDNGAEVELIEHGRNGLLCSPMHIQQWVDALKQILADPERRKALAQEALQDFNSNYTYNVFLDKMWRIYNE